MLCGLTKHYFYYNIYIIFTIFIFKHDCNLGLYGILLIQDAQGAQTIYVSTLSTLCFKVKRF